MKKFLLFTLIAMLFIGKAEAGGGYWNGFWGGVIAGSLVQPPPPPVVIVNPSPQEPQYVYDQGPIYTFIGTITAIEGNVITVQDQRGATSTFKTCSTTKNLMGKPIEANDQVEIFPTGARFDLIDSIRLAAPVVGNVSGSDNVESRLKKAKSLLERGLISDKEYDAARQRILNDL